MLGPVLNSSDRTGVDAIPPVDGYQFVTGFTPGPGGVATDEVGVVSGELTLRTEVAADGEALLHVQPAGGTEWYTVAGGHYALDDPRQAERLHGAAVRHLAPGGADAAALSL